MLVLYGASNYNAGMGEKMVVEARRFIEEFFKKSPMKAYVWEILIKIKE